MDENVSFWRSFGVGLVCWTAVGIILGWGTYSGDRDEQNYLPIAHYLVWAAADAYSWAIITAFLFSFARRYPIKEKDLPRRVVEYALFAAGVVLVRPLLMTLFGWFYKPDQHQSFTETASLLREKEMVMTIQITVVLFILSAYQNARREARLRQLREAELESRASTAELQMLKMQLQPHFLFNSLQAATVLIHEDPVAAENVLQRLSELLRVALDDMRSMQVPLEQEVTFLRHYIEIQKYRFQSRLEVRLSIAHDVLPVSVPSLILQPLVENAIHHGIGRHKGSDVIEVIAQRHGDFLLLQVKNTASELSESSQPFGNRIGLKNTRARLQQMYGDQACVSLTPLSPTGVCATVTIPMENSV
jgi:sensor histidine kinase YesM